MNYPQYPNQTGYPPQQAPAYPPPGQYPQQGQYPPQQYPPQQAPNYPPAAPPQPAPRGSLDGFMGQPAGGGKSIASWFQQIGQSLTGRIARDVTDADTQIQTNMVTKQIDASSYYKDGRPKLTLAIPLLLVNPPPEFADGRAAWIVSITDYRTEILPAMEAAGVPKNADGSMPFPEKDATMIITYTESKQLPGFGAPKKVKSVQYFRPGQPVTPQQAMTPQYTPQPGYPQGAPQPVQNQWVSPQQQPPQAPNQYQQPMAQPVPQPQPGTATTAPPQTGYPGQTQGGPEGMDPAHQALLAKLAAEQGQAPPQQ